jgi:ribosomal protein S18 acetylase RimI-like enzyme
MSVTLRPMTGEEFASWLPKVPARYASHMETHAGLAPEAAKAKAAQDTENLFPNGQPSAEQLVFVVEAEGERVGELWLSERENDSRRVLWIFNIEVSEEHRGRGFGRAAMKLAEEEAQRRGLSHVALNVFGGNEPARRLYRSLGYSENAVWMSKAV